MAIIISSKTQQLIWQDLVANQKIIYDVSTAKNGLGEQKNSYKTPRGRHIIRAKIGDECPINTIFKARRSAGEIFSKTNCDAKKDWILTRILWLSGTEIGFNRLGDLDTMQRYIYIHGTNDEENIGKPVSCGCIRMRNRDILELFDLVRVGEEVNII